MNIFLGLLITLAPAEPKVPTLRTLDRGDYLAINPLRKSITMHLNCGLDWKTVVLRLSAQSNEAVRIVDPNNRDASCFLEGYY